MATVTRGGWFRRNHKAITASGTRIEFVGHGRGLTAAANRLDISDRKEAARQMRLRQGWQFNAWAYRDSIGELRYALNFLANCAARMKIFPAVYPQGGETDNPVPLAELDEQVPASVITACAAAMQALGNGRWDISDTMRRLSTNKSVAGECFLLGEEDPLTGDDTWSIRSISEILIKDDKYYLREVPTDSQGVLGQRELDPELCVISRIWTPHPQYRMWADSPMRAMQDDCESLLILRRMIRAAGRSRLAGAGILGIPEGLEIKMPDNDNGDPEADPFLGLLTEAMMTPLDNEGAASAVVPIVIRGKGELLKEITHITLGQQFAKEDADTRAELVGVIATTLDLPKEIITGMMDANHWTAWQIDDSTFRHHVEPHVILCCDSLTGAFLRPFLEVENVPVEWVKRLLLWYDPTELVTHPDRAKDAQTAYDAMALSGEALRNAYGFSETDKPTIEELEMRRVMDIRALPLNLLMEYASRADPTLIVPPMTGPPQLPGIKPGGGVDVGAAPPTAGALPPAGGTIAGESPKPSVDTAAPGPPSADRPEPKPPAIIAAGADPAARLSRKLAEIDRDLRARLQIAANAAMLRQLERVGNRLRSKVAKDETMRTKIAHRANERVAAILGPEIVTAAGVNVDQLLGDGWTGLQAQFMQWTETAQKQALKLALRLGGLDATDDAARQAEQAMAEGRDRAWEVLSGALTGLSEHLLYNPDPNTAAGDWGDLNPQTLVPAGTIRAALAIAGGTDTSAVTVGEQGATALMQPVGQIGTGATIGGLLTSAGGETDRWEWSHASTAQNPFEPHEDLDGVEFDSFTDDVLANTGDWPPVEYYLPGDHSGCLCDAVPLWNFSGASAVE
jgi:hypothetical protein